MRKLIILFLIAFVTMQTKAQSWNLTGNSGTVDSINFIGTIDNIPFNIHVNNQKAGRIDHIFGNTFYGYQSGNSISTGNSNTANGYRALYSNTTANYNTAIGVNALFHNTIGGENTATGMGALLFNTAGRGNTANGVEALSQNAEGDYNTAIGHKALSYNKGYQNTASGSSALFSNGSGSANTATGSSSLFTNSDGEYNTANGYRALYSNTKANHNTANGAYTLYSNTVGNYNTASGYSSLFTNSTGNYNSALGYFADVSSPDLNYATAIGSGAKVKTSNTIQLGNDSVTKVYAGVGTNATLIAGGLQITGGAPAAGKVLTSDANGIATWQIPMGGGGTGWGLTGTAGTLDGINFIGTNDNVPFNIRVNNQKAGRIDHLNANTFYGYQSGFNTIGRSNTANGYKALSSNTIGKYNTAHGANALLLNATGDYNTAIGYNAGPNDEMFINTTAIGYGAITTADNQVRIGNSDVTSIGGKVDWSKVSDGRVKKDIKEEVPGLAFISKLRPVTYRLNTNALAAFLKIPDNLRLKSAEASSEAELQTGFIAQEVEKAAQKLNFEFSGVDKPKNQNDLYGLRYAEFTVPLVKAVQELSKQNDSLKEKLNNQQQQIENILQQLNQLKSGNSSFNNTNGAINKKDFGITTPTLKVYPNPASQSLTLTSNYELKDAKIQLSDMLGNLKNIIVQDVDKYSKRILVNNLSAGIYIITVNNGQKIESTKIIIQ